MIREKSIVETANNKVDIFDACRIIGMAVRPAYDVRSIKTYCPFGEISHSDEGASPAFRIYPNTNSAFCFACQTLFTPAKLASMAWDMPLEEAAERLLTETGYKPLSVEEAWQQALNPPEQPPDLAALGMALRVFCQRQDANWETLQFEPGVSKWLDQCLSLLTYVRTDKEAREWLEGSQNIMRNILRG